MILSYNTFSFFSPYRRNKSLYIAYRRWMQNPQRRGNAFADGCLRDFAMPRYTHAGVCFSGNRLSGAGRKIAYAIFLLAHASWQEALKSLLSIHGLRAEAKSRETDLARAYALHTHGRCCRWRLRGGFRGREFSVANSRVSAGACAGGL
jgi:hypothetical protein